MSKKKILIIITSIVLLCTITTLVIVTNKKSITTKSGVKKENNSIDYSDDLPSDSIHIDLNNLKSNDNYTYKNGVLTINKKGVYDLTGKFEGEVVVNTSGNVRLILNNAEIKSNNTPAIYVEDAKKVVITILKGTTNKISDTTNYSNEELDGVIYSTDDLVINGDGKLEVVSNYKDGIVSKDTLKIVNGNITINSSDDAIRGKDSILIENGTFDITSGGHGIKTTNEKMGTIEIKNGKFDINTEGDGINSIGDITIDSGEFNIKAKDDGIHSTATLNINGGKIKIEESYEGLEGLSININGGDIKVNSSDDGINAAGGNDKSGFGPMNDMFAVDEDANITINGGNVYINTEGDGVDSNGNITMTGGSLTIDGPVNDGNGSLDYNGTFDMKGGTLISSGSSGMLQTPSSGQNVLSIINEFEEGDVISIKEGDNEIINFTVGKKSGSVVISSKDIKTNNTYNVYVNGKLLTEMKTSSRVTTYGNSKIETSEKTDKLFMEERDNINEQKRPMERR